MQRDHEKDAFRLVTRFLKLILRGFVNTIFGYEKGCKEASEKFEKMFPEPNEEEVKEMEKRTPPNMRWWCAQKRLPSIDEKELVCKTCNQILGTREVKECPNCRAVMHTDCYDRPYGDSYQTPDCDACYHRCYSR
jgi:hypothetical protein